MAIQDSFNQLLGTVAGAAVSGKHLANQEKANNISIDNQVNALNEEGVNIMQKDESLIDQQAFNDYKEHNLRNVSEGAIADAEKAIESGNMTDIQASKKAIQSLQDKWDALQFNKMSIETQREQLQEQWDLHKDKVESFKQNNKKFAKRFEEVTYDEFSNRYKESK